MLKIQKFVFNNFYENSYLVWQESTRESLIIDPGCYTEEEENKLKDFILNNNLTVKYLINTHCHIDHILGNNFVKNEFNPLFIIPEKDKILLEQAKQKVFPFDIKLKQIPKVDEYILTDKDYYLGRIKFKFLFTPGHTPGEVCVYFENEKVCFTGDVLFNEGIGRTDLWGGDYNQLMESIKNELMTLPDDTLIYCGHGIESTIGNEKKYNSFLKSLS